MEYKACTLLLLVHRIHKPWITPFKLKLIFLCPTGILRLKSAAMHPEKGWRIMKMVVYAVDEAVKD